MNPAGKNDSADTREANDLFALMERIGRRDVAALGYLFDATVGNVYARALRITVKISDAEEVTRRVYHQLWQQAGEFDPRHGSPLQWLMIVARNLALITCRERRIACEMPGFAADIHADNAGSDINHALWQFDLAPTICLALSKLNPVQARIIALTFFDGLSHLEIADCTHIPLASVKLHLCRALIQLQKAVGDADHADTPINTLQLAQTITATDR